MRRRTPAVVLVALLTGALSLPLVAPAFADPGDDDVAAAQAAVASDAQAVARIELELSDQQAVLDQAWTAVSVAGEAYTQASVDAQAAADESALATQRSDRADRDAQAAREDLGRVALEAYRSGGSMDTLGALVQADGLQDLLARQDAVDRLGKRAQTAVQRLEAAQLVAQTLQDRAHAAEKAATAAQDLASTKLAAAQSAQDAAQQTVAQVQAERDRLVDQLAQARHVAVEVERERQAQLDAERQARAEAAARAQRTGTATQAPNPAPTTPAPSTPAPSNPAPSNPAPANPAPTTPAPTTPAPSTPAPTNPPAPTPAPTTPAPSPTPAPSTPGLGTGTSRGSAAAGQAALDWARAQVGKAYVYGAAGPETFDCSGLTMRAWQAAGVSLNRTSRDQYRQVLKISYNDLRPGDLVFYGDDPNDWTSVYHVAMYVGGGQVVEAPRPGLAVRVTSMRWTDSMAFAGRP